MGLRWLTFFIIAVCLQSKHATESKNCTMAGRFPNDLDNNCRGYTMCLSVHNDFFRIDLDCPEKSIFSHVDSQCTNITSYQCLTEYNCTEVGDLPNPFMSGCGSYISCVDGMDGIVTARLTLCPSDMVFDPAKSSCVNNTLFKCEATIPEPPKVFEVSVKFSPEAIDVNSSSYTFYKKTNYIIFLVLLICYFNKI